METPPAPPSANGAGLVDRIASRPRVLAALAVLLTALGVHAWLSMPRQEDPDVPDWVGYVDIRIPGADPESVELRTVVRLEEELAALEDVQSVDSFVVQNGAHVRIVLRDDVDDADAAWAKVQEALQLAEADFPDSAEAPVLEHGFFGRTEAIILSISGSSDRRELLSAARRLKQSMLLDPDVAEVQVVPDSEERIVIDLDEAATLRTGLSSAGITAQIQQRNTAIPGGSVRLGQRTLSIVPNTELASLAEIRAMQMMLPTGEPVPLGELAQVRSELSNDEGLVRVNGHLGVAVGIVPRLEIDIVEFGERVRERVGSLRPKLSPFVVTEIVFQPDHVESRLSELTASLVGGIALITLVLLALMGLRLGLVVASVVPLVAFTSLAIFSCGGGILHQISISALVLSLGMVVDNAIVVANDMQKAIDQGATPREPFRPRCRR